MTNVVSTPAPAEATVRTVTAVRATVGAVLVLAGCGGDGGVTGAREASTAKAPNAPTVFTSARHAYRVELPAGWFVQPTEGTWKGPLRPGDPGVDTFTNADATIRVFAATRATGRDIERAEWTRRMRADVPALCTLTTTSKRTVAGEPAHLASYSCSDGYEVVLATTVHRGRGFAIACASREGSEAAGRRAFRRVLESFGFVG